MDYNEFLMNLYIVNVGPITASEWFHIAMGVLQGGGMAGGFLAIIVDWVGKDTIQQWLLEAQAAWEHDTVKTIGNGTWTVYAGDPLAKCGSSRIYNDAAVGGDLECIKYPYEMRNGEIVLDADGNPVIDDMQVLMVGWAFNARLYFRGIEGLGPMDAIITAIWDTIYQVVQMLFSYATGELKKAGQSSMEGQSTSTDAAGTTAALDLSSLGALGINLPF